MKNWQAPTPEEIRAWLDSNGLTQADAAKLAKINARTFRRYTAHTGAQSIPYAVWFTITTRQRIRLLDAEKRGELPPIE